MARLIDLSHPIEAGMTTYPGLPGPILRTHMSREESRSRYGPGTEFHIGTIEMVANTGTYLDTPFHRYAEGYDLAGLRLESCADLDGLCVRTNQRRIGPESLADLDVEGCAVLFHTGWDVHWRTEGYGADEHPHLSAEAADLLIERGAALVGIDSVNIDDTGAPLRPAHSNLLAAGIPIVEHLTGLGALPESAFRFFAVPAPVRQMGTFPVRAFALVV